MPPTGVCGQRHRPPQSSPGRAGAAAPRGEMGRIPLLGSEGLSCGDRDTVGASPGHSLPLPTPGTANAACPQVTPPFSQQGLSPKSSPCASHPGAKGQPGSGAGGRAGHPWGRGEVTGRGGGLTYSSRKISTNFPNLLELLFLTVLALPKDSSKGVASRICRSDGERPGRVSPGTLTHHGLFPWWRDHPCHPPIMPPSLPPPVPCRHPAGAKI